MRDGIWLFHLAAAEPERFAVVDVPVCNAEKDKARRTRYDEMFDTSEDRVWMYEMQDGAKEAYKQLSTDPLKFLQDDGSGDDANHLCVPMRNYVGQASEG